MSKKDKYMEAIKELVRYKGLPVDTILPIISPSGTIEAVSVSGKATVHGSHPSILIADDVRETTPLTASTWADMPLPAVGDQLGDYVALIESGEPFQIPAGLTQEMFELSLADIDRCEYHSASNGEQCSNIGVRLRLKDTLGERIMLQYRCLEHGWEPGLVSLLVLDHHPNSANHRRKLETWPMRWPAGPVLDVCKCERPSMDGGEMCSKCGKVRNPFTFTGIV